MYETGAIIVDPSVTLERLWLLEEALMAGKKQLLHPWEKAGGTMYMGQPHQCCWEMGSQSLREAGEVGKLHPWRLSKHIWLT